MPVVSVTELRTRASEIVRQVRERRARYVITYRGQPVGVLEPLDTATGDEAPRGREPAEVWAELTRLGEQIGRGWQSPLSSAQLLSQMRG